MNKKIILIFITISLALFWISYVVLDYDKTTKIEEYLEAKTKQYTQNYKVLYDEHKRLSEMIFTTRINTKPVIDIFKDAILCNSKKKDEVRLKLYQSLKTTYALLKKFNITQLHFHLANNESFLRFYSLDKYGDNLTNIRSTVEYVNKYKKPVDGFEKGRIFNGYRFVYPLFYKDKHIGSVEISFSTLAMSKDFMHDYDVTSSFLILKSVVEEKNFKEEQCHYMPSLIKNFSLEKKMLKLIQNERSITTMQAISKETEEILNTKALSPHSFSVYDSKTKQIMTFIKVKNPISHRVVGLFIARSSAQYIFNKTNNFYLLLSLINFFIIAILFLIYKELKYRKKIEFNNQQLYISRQEVLELNQTLEMRVQEEVAKNRKKDKQMLHQSRLAQMGEMISMIAHQWRQPLGAISATAIDMKIQIELETFDLDKKEDKELCLSYFLKNLDSIDGFVNNLTTTIDDFRNFYKPNKKISLVSMAEPIDTALKILKPILSIDSIEILLKDNSSKQIELYANEIVQVMINILKNAQDNFKEKKISDAKISIVIENNIEGVTIKICDNGGGIQDDIIEKIFDPYFSTKSEKNGTGLGLYMSQMIIQEHHNGKFSVKNSDAGVCFKIELKEKIDN